MNRNGMKTTKIINVKNTNVHVWNKGPKNVQKVSFQGPKNAKKYERFYIISVWLHTGTDYWFKLIFTDYLQILSLILANFTDTDEHYID